MSRWLIKLPWKTPGPSQVYALEQYWREIRLCVPVWGPPAVREIFAVVQLNDIERGIKGIPPVLAPGED
jgi:hypothetical protein